MCKCKIWHSIKASLPGADGEVSSSGLEVTKIANDPHS